MKLHVLPFELYSFFCSYAQKTTIYNKNIYTVVKKAYVTVIYACFALKKIGNKQAAAKKKK